MTVWEITKKLCYIIEFSCPANINIVNKVSEENILWIINQKHANDVSKLEANVIPIIVGALGHVPECLFTNIQNLDFTKNETKKLAKKLQVLSVTRIVKICKKFMSFEV